MFLRGTCTKQFIDRQPCGTHTGLQIRDCPCDKANFRLQRRPLSLHLGLTSVPSCFSESQSWYQGIPCLFSIQVAAVGLPGPGHRVSILGCSRGAPCWSTSCIYSKLQQWGSLVEYIVYLFLVAAVGLPGRVHPVSIPGCSGGAPWHRATMGADGEDNGLIHYTCSLLACLPAVHLAMTFPELRAPLAS